MSEVLKKFGRYFLLDRLAQGGMAEIYRARLASADGGSRLLVIKRIQASYDENNEFLQMFKAEIKVTMGFNHPNIVQVYDFGEERGQPFIAMEYVDGKNARQFLNRFIEIKQAFPIEIAVYIAEQIASGLHYAHSYKDKVSGEPLSIVHRDVSPQNILISYDGNIKVIDFGIAKATTNIESTRAGVIKGKPSYLSPEQISGETLDARSDIFALGTVLWELLSGKKLFSGENDLAVLKLIESSQTYIKAPSTLNPKIPKELDQIVLKTLSKQRENRYQTAEELQRALHKFLYSFMPEFNPADISYYAKDLFKNDIIEDRKRIQQLSHKAEQLLQIQIPDPVSIQDGELDLEVQTSEEKTAAISKMRDKTSASSGGREFNINEKENSKIEMEKAPPPRASNTGSGSYKNPISDKHTPTPFSKQTLADKSISRIPHTKAKTRPNSLPLAIGSVLLALGISYVGPKFGIYIPILSNLVSPGGSEAALEKSTTSSGQSERASASDTSFSIEGDNTIQLKLNISPIGDGVKILLNNKPLNPMDPSARVSLDAPLELSIQQAGFKPVTREFVLDSKQMNGLKEWAMDVTLEPLHFGFLTIRTIPSADATAKIGNIIWKRKTPIQHEKMPNGTYTIELKNSVLGMEKLVTVTIEEGKSTNIDERLEIKN